MAKSASARDLSDPAPSPSDSACHAADTLLRAALDSARQHDRLARCLELGCSDEELLHIAEVTALTDVHLAAMTSAYEQMATAAPSAKTEPWWHAANGLWHAAREFTRRNVGTDRVQRVSGKHSKEKFAELTMEFELERSASMALRQAANALKAVRPGAV